MKLMLASSNAHKLEEFQELFKDSGIELVIAPESIEVEETGDTYIENASLKAIAYFDKYSVPVISDDSGLNVEALPKLLGVKSARFAPELSNQTEKNEKLLELLKDSDNREAYFTSQLCCYLNPEEIFFFEGVLKGSIAHDACGEQGFGYDPVFIAESRTSTLAEDQDWKNENSHRARAVQEAIKFFANNATS